MGRQSREHPIEETHHLVHEPVFRGHARIDAALERCPAGGYVQLAFACKKDECRGGSLIMPRSGDRELCASSRDLYGDA